MRPLAHTAIVPPSGTPEEEEPFYGWRSVRRTEPDGTEVVDEIPLCWEDLLYPEEGDFVVYEPVHTQDFIYCHSTIEAFYAAQPNIVVLGDCRVDWGVAGIRPLGPDILVLFDVREWLRQGTYHLPTEGGRPALVIEIASPSTRRHDVGAKRDFYYQFGVEKYVIVDRGPRNAEPVKLLGYQHDPSGWLPLPLDAQGRLDLAPVGLLLGVEEDRPWLYNAITGARELDRSEWQQALTEAEDRARGAEDRARGEAQARAALEEQVRALQAALRQQQG